MLNMCVKCVAYAFSVVDVVSRRWHDLYPGHDLFYYSTMRSFATLILFSLSLTHCLSLSLHPILPSVSLCWFAVVAAGVVLLLLLAYTLDRCEFILICLLPGSAHEFVIWIPKCASGFIIYFPRSVGVCVCFLFLLSIRRLFYPITDFCTDYNR